MFSQIKFVSLNKWFMGIETKGNAHQTFSKVQEKFLLRVELNKAWVKIFCLFHIVKKCYVTNRRDVGYNRRCQLPCMGPPFLGGHSASREVALDPLCNVFRGLREALSSMEK